MVVELDKQRAAKLEKQKKLKAEDQAYHGILTDHLKALDRQEEEKSKAKAEKINLEKMSRDQQLQKTKHNRRKEVRQNMEQEQKTIDRLMAEIEREK